MIRMGVSGCVFLLVPSYPGCPGPRAVERLCVCGGVYQYVSLAETSLLEHSTKVQDPAVL